MSQGLARRKSLFLKFSSQLLLLKQMGVIIRDFKYDQPYICPICLDEFSENDLYESSDKNFLTLEDAPPNSLGGNKIALTCKKCNSECGHNIDFHLAEILKSIDNHSLFQGSKTHMTVEFEGTPLNAEVISKGNGLLEVRHDIKKNNPIILEKFINSLKNKDSKPVLNIFPPKSRHEPDKVNYALVKTNYIITFAKFGYIFLLNEQYSSIRKQLLKPNSEIYPFTFFIKDQFQRESIGTYYAHNQGIESIFNVFSLRTKYSETLIGGFIPLPTLSSDEFAKRLEIINSNPLLTLETTTYDPDVDLFHDEREIGKILNWISKTK